MDFCENYFGDPNYFGLNDCWSSVSWMHELNTYFSMMEEEDEEDKRGGKSCRLRF